MPESSRMVPLYMARIADLRLGTFVTVTCRRCGHLAELPALGLRERLSRNAFVKDLGPQFRCKSCTHKGARVDARAALGYFR